jgi:hypothetical protein
LGGGLVLGAVLPAVFGVLFLVSAALHRPVLARALPQYSTEIAQRLTVVWGIVLVVIGALQGAGALIGIGSITSASGLAVRFVFALIAEIVVLGATVAYLRRIHGGSPLTGER